MTDIARLGFSIDSSQITKAVAELAGLQRAGESAARSTQDLGQAFAQASAKISLVSSGGLRTSMLGQLAEDARKAYEATRDFARMTGESQGRIVAFSQVAKDMGISLENSAAGFTRFGQVLTNVGPQTELARRTLQAYGVSLKDSEGNLKSQARLLTEVAEKFKDVRDSAEKTRDIRNVFGSGGSSILKELAGSSIPNERSLSRTEATATFEANRAAFQEAFATRLAQFERDNSTMFDAIPNFIMSKQMKKNLESSIKELSEDFGDMMLDLDRNFKNIVDQGKLTRQILKEEGNDGFFKTAASYFEQLGQFVRQTATSLGSATGNQVAGGFLPPPLPPGGTSAPYVKSDQLVSLEKELKALTESNKALLEEGPSAQMREQAAAAVDKLYVAAAQAGNPLNEKERPDLLAAQLAALNEQSLKAASGQVFSLSKQLEYQTSIARAMGQAGVEADRLKAKLAGELGVGSNKGAAAQSLAGNISDLTFDIGRAQEQGAINQQGLAAQIEGARISGGNADIGKLSEDRSYSAAQRSITSKFALQRAKGLDVDGVQGQELSNLEASTIQTRLNTLSDQLRQNESEQISIRSSIDQIGKSFAERSAIQLKLVEDQARSKLPQALSEDELNKQEEAVKAVVNMTKERLELEKQQNVFQQTMSLSATERYKREVDALREIEGELLARGVTEEEIARQYEAMEMRKLDASRKWEDGAIRGLRRYGDEATNMAANVDRSVTSMLRSLEDELVSFTTKGEFNFRKLADTIIQEMARTQIRSFLGSAASAVGGSGGGDGIFGFLGKMFGGGGGGGFFDNANGNAFASAGVVPFANGGIFSSPTLFAFGNGGRLGVMGEAGPEAIMPLARGGDGKLGVRGGSGGGNTEVVIIDQRGANAAPVQTRQTTGTDGKQMISILIRDEVKQGLARGDYDSTLNSSFGINRGGRR